MRCNTPALVALLLLAPTSAADCSTAFDCSLGGECVAGQCKCDATWTGKNCVQLNLLPVDKSSRGYRWDMLNQTGSNQSTASWGGLPVYVDGEYHLIHADFDKGCGLGCWGTNSQVARSVSNSPTGPYRKAEVIAPPFHHNPTVNKVPNGPFVVVAIGNGSASLPPAPAPGSVSAAVGDPADAGVIMMLYSDSIKGPWKQRPGVILEPGANGTWDSFVTNPSIFFFPNGSALMAYRGGPCLKGKENWCDFHKIGMAFAPSWDAEFKRIGTAPVFENQTEDPGIFRDARGHFHILGHYFGKDGHGAGPGGHAFSEDGITWHFAGQAYDFDIVYTDGSQESFSRRERPQVLMIDGEPAVLFSGVEGKELFGKHSWTLAQRIATSKTRVQYI